MKTIVKIVMITIIGLALTVTSGLAEEKMPQSGFLTDYSKLVQGDPLKFVDWFYKNEKANLGAYDKIMMEQASFIVAEDSKYKALQLDEINELSNAAHSAVIEELSGNYTFTDQPGPGVMILRVAFTNIQANKPVMGTVTTIVPVGLLFSAGKKAVTGNHMGVGTATMEAELVDSQTNEILMAGIDTTAGKKYSVIKNASKWGQMKLNMRMWAIGFSERLDKESGKQ